MRDASNCSPKRAAPSPALDPFGKIPEFKYCAARIPRSGTPPLDPGYGRGGSLGPTASAQSRLGPFAMLSDIENPFSTDPRLRGAPAQHVISVREVRLAAGAEFIVMICGEIMTLPDLPKLPAAGRIDSDDGKVVGSF